MLRDVDRYMHKRRRWLSLGAVTPSACSGMNIPLEHHTHLDLLNIGLVEARSHHLHSEQTLKWEETVNSCHPGHSAMLC
jgi:hypothetical protein